MNGQRAVWGYFAVSITSLVLGATLVVLGWAKHLPPEAELKKLTGSVDTVTVIDSLSGTSTLLSTPLNEIHFTLQGIETTLRYPNGWPGYSDLYDRLSFEVDVWVDPNDLLHEGPVTVYRLEQRLPEGWASQPISISYQSIADIRGAGHSSYFTAGIGLVTLAPVPFLVGVWMVRWNRRNLMDPKAD